MSTYNSRISSIDVRKYNKYAVLDLIRFSPGGLSRADLARQIGLTRSAITTIVNDLLRLGVIREMEENGSTTGGRRPIPLEINPQRGYVAGIDLGATHVAIEITDYAAQVLFEIDTPITIASGPEKCLSVVDSKLRALLETADLKIDDLAAIGVGVPGPVVADVGSVVAPPIMPGWSNFPIRDHLQSLWQCPVTVSNDAELGVLGEWAYGAGRGESDLVYLKVGTGIGAGLFLNGHIYRGATGGAGEIGHITIDEHGPMCTCGNRGCLEALAGGRAIARLAKQAVKAGRRTQLASGTPVDEITALDVAIAARKGDLVAQEIMAKAGEYLGIAIANLINLINPAMIVVGGGVAQVGDLLLEPMRQAVQEHSLPAMTQAVRITAAILGRRSSGMGAVVNALTIALHQEIENS